MTALCGTRLRLLERPLAFGAPLEAAGDFLAASAAEGANAPFLRA